MIVNVCPDGHLLKRYFTHQDEAAFAALVERFRPLVLGVCRRVLRDQHEAEDACQATFLVLLRRAGSLDGTGSLANWLSTVAYRTARKARARAARRQSRERQLLESPVAPAGGEVGGNELRLALEEELSRLPDIYRAPLVLCCLQGNSHQQAARLLGWPSGSMSRRLLRARQLLREGLTRRGLLLPTGVGRRSPARAGSSGGTE